MIIRTQMSSALSIVALLTNSKKDMPAASARP